MLALWRVSLSNELFELQRLEVLSDGYEKVKPKLLQLQELLESMCMLACLVRFLPHHGCFCS